jgi:hypothetical protein
MASLKKTVLEPPIAPPPAAPDVEAALGALKGAQNLGEAGRRLRHAFPNCGEIELLAALREAHRRIADAWARSPVRRELARFASGHRGESHEDDL